MLRAFRIALVVIAAGMLCGLAAQDKNPDQPKSEWISPAIQGYGQMVPLPNAAVQPDKNRTYKMVFLIEKAADDPKDVSDGVDHLARLYNMFQSLGVPLKNLKVVAVFTGPATYDVLNNDVYRAKYKQDNPNLKALQELKEAGAELYVCGQAMHFFKFDEKQLSPDVKLATSALVVLTVYENQGYGFIPF